MSGFLGDNGSGNQSGGSSPDASSSVKGLIKLSNNLAGTADNPIVKNLTIDNQEQGSLLYFNGTNWIVLPPGSNGEILGFYNNLPITLNGSEIIGPANNSSLGLIQLSQHLGGTAESPKVINLELPNQENVLYGLAAYDSNTEGWSTLPEGYSFQFLMSNGFDAPPSWEYIDIPKINTGLIYLDFGTDPGGKKSASFVVQQQSGMGNISVDKPIFAELIAIDNPDHTMEECKLVNQYSKLTITNVIYGTSFTICMDSELSLTGVFQVNWYWQPGI